MVLDSGEKAFYAVPINESKKLLNPFYLAIQAVLSLFATGRKTGMVLDSGEKAFYAVPINESKKLLNPCFISLLYLDLYVLGDDALIS